MSKEEKAEKNRQSVARYYKKNRDMVLAKQKEKALPKKRRALAISLLGGVCIQCGYSDIRALQIDHIHGGGSKARREQNMYGHQIYTYIITHTQDAMHTYQLLCANCNWIKRYDNNECIGKYSS